MHPYTPSLPLPSAGTHPQMTDQQSVQLDEAIAKGLAQLDRGERLPYDPAAVRALADARFLKGERPDFCVVP